MAMALALDRTGRETVIWVNWRGSAWTHAGSVRLCDHVRHGLQGLNLRQQVVTLLQLERKGGAEIVDFLSARHDLALLPEIEDAGHPGNQHRHDE
jgi:hypothetical protein